MKLQLITSLAAAACTLFAAETLNTNFDGGYQPIGSKGISYPAANLVSQKQGSIFMGFKLDEMQPPVNIQRVLMALRTRSRATIGFYYYRDKTLQFSFSDQKQTYLFHAPEKLVTGRDYNIGFTWDGTIVRIYLEGRVVAEAPQPLSLPEGKIGNLNIGPYSDQWYAPKTWADDTFVKYLRVYDTALTPQEVAKQFDVAFTPLAQSNPQSLKVPAIPAGCAVPTADGKLNEDAWKYAASMPRLIDASFMETSGNIPPHNFKIMYDQQNLYLGFTSTFPGGSNLQEGNVRTPEKEPEVFGDESFEFYIRHDGILYRFAGNVAGGNTERRVRDYTWEKPWKYVSTKEMKIDDSILWQGEIIIPWTSLDLNAPPTGDVDFNFCRNWKLPECGAWSSLRSEGGSYGPTDTTMIPVKFTQAPTIQILEQNDPNTGEYTQTYQIASSEASQVTYDVALARRDGAALPMSVLHRTFNLTKNSPTVSEKQDIKILTPGYDCILYTLSDKNGIAMQHIVPFKLNEDFFAVTPYYLQDKLLVALKPLTLKNKFGADFSGNLLLKTSKGAVITQLPAQGMEIVFPFDSKKLEPGTYSLELLDAKGEAVASKELKYPGIGDWARQNFHPERIIPPYIPMTHKQAAGSLETSLICRKYTWNNSVLPTQIISEDEPLFAKPAQVLVNGTPLATSQFKVTSSAAHHIDFTTEHSKSWLEYDGVQWNELTVTADKKGQTLDLQFTLPASIAKFIHGTYCHSWGSKITRSIPNEKLVLNWMPIIWLGNQEKGFCFFAEERNAWNSPKEKTYTIEKKGDTVVFTVHIAANLPANKPYTVQFGVLGTPVKTQKQLPFDVMGWDYTLPLNRPGRRPTVTVSMLKTVSGGDLGNFFADMDNPEAEKSRQALTKMLAAIANQKDVSPMPYTSANYLSVKYPEVAAYLPEWVHKPEKSMDYQHTNHFVYECCPVTMANDFFVWKVKGILKRFPGLKGIYFDFGSVSECSNTSHGCNNRVPILAFREYFRRIAIAQLEAGIEHPVLSVHNTDFVMVPCYTFVTNLLNGEQIRQESSALLHNKRDIIDSMPFEHFATELSSIPFGITNSVYFPFDKLAAKYGGDEEDTPYKFRLGKAGFAVTLPHNTIPDQSRNHYGIFDKLIRTYDQFGVDRAKFIGYWRNPTTVSGGKGIIVSCYVIPSENKLLAVMGHVDKAHENQDFTVTFDWKKLGFTKAPTTATDTMTAPDPDYDWLFEHEKKYHVRESRAPLTLGDFGSKVTSFDGTTLKMHLDYHCFAVVEIK